METWKLWKWPAKAEPFKPIAFEIRDVLGFNFPLSPDETIETRGALLSALSKITRLEDHVNALNALVQLQIEDIKRLEKLCQENNIQPLVHSKLSWQRLSSLRLQARSTKSIGKTPSR